MNEQIEKESGVSIDIQFEMKPPLNDIQWSTFGINFFFLLNIEICRLHFNNLRESLYE